MWKVLPRFGLIKVAAFLFAVLLLSTVVVLLGDSSGTVQLGGTDFIKAVKSSSLVSLLFVLIVWLIAKWGWKPLWLNHWLGRLLNKTVCPDLNGSWNGEIVSSFKDSAGKPVTKEVQMEIIADFLGFDINLMSKDNYQRSTVVQSEIYKDSRDGVFYVSYVFESVVDLPEPTDDSKFDGAAKLAVRFVGESIELIGTYWTNRAWQRGDNTAGMIRLSRSVRS